MKQTRGNSGPTIRPVDKVTLSEKNTKGRLFLVVALIVVAVVAFTAGLIDFLQPESGWQEIDASSVSETVCTQEFSMSYHLGASGISANAENKLVTRAYAKAADEAYKIFTNEIFVGVNNVAYVNAHVNEVVTVPEALYEAFVLLNEYDSRYLYLAPVYEQYRGLFMCTTDADAQIFDSYLNPENKEYFAEVAAYANRPEMINIEILGDNQVKLTVSDEYLAYANESGITSYIDFFWLKNAFVLDYIAESLTAQNYTKGTITSFDGFSRTLDMTGSEYAFHIYDRIGQNIYPAAAMKYTKPMSIVSYRNYPVSDLDRTNYYELENGEIRTPFADIKDGMCKSSLNNLAAISETRSCGETAVVTYGLYATDRFDKEELENLQYQDVDVIYCEDAKIYSTKKDVNFTNLYQDETVSYQIAE